MKTNNLGELIEPKLHDGFAEALRMKRSDKSAILECVTEKGVKIVIQFIDIRAMEGNDFQQGNVINTITIYQGITIPEAEITYFFFNQYSEQDAVRKKIQEFHNSGEKMFHLIPSYGLELKVFCREIDIKMVTD